MPPTARVIMAALRLMPDGVIGALIFRSTVRNRRLAGFRVSVRFGFRVKLRGAAHAWNSPWTRRRAAVLTLLRCGPFYHPALIAS